MAVNYLKKTKMYELARKLRPDIVGIRKCEYKFYHGSEWLKWSTDEPCEDGYIEFKLYRCGAHLHLDRVQHLDSEFKAVTLTHDVFVLHPDMTFDAVVY